MIKLNYSYALAFADLTNFKANFIKALCSICIPPLNTSQLHVDNVTSGSTIVTFTIFPPYNPALPSAAAIVDQLQDQISTPGSPLLADPLLGTAVVGQNLSKGEVTTPMYGCPNGGFAASVSACPASASGSNGVDKSLALGLGLGFGIPYIIVLAVVIYRSRASAQANRGPDRNNKDIPMTPLDKKGDAEHTSDGPPGLESPEDNDNPTPARTTTGDVGSPSATVSINT